MPKIPTITENADGWSDWIRPNMKGFRQICCSCGLAHDWQYKKTEDGIEFRIRENSRSTAAVRRKRPK